MTSGIGIVQSPALSKDGAVVAVAATPEAGANPQIWVRGVDGKSPAMRLTDDAWKNYDPEFSADGRNIYFTSTRPPEGIYRVPLTGGTPELAIENAYSAKISTDGKTMLYGMGGKLYRRDFQGNTATEVLPGVDNSYAPVLSPDGARVLFTAKNRDETETEWWIAPVAAGEAHRTAIAGGLREQGFDSAFANAWLPGDWIVFSGLQGQTQTLWKVQMESESKVAGKAVRATEDAQGDSSATFTAGKLAFARTRVEMNFWALPLDSTGERLTGPPQPLTSSTLSKGQESAAGSRLLFSQENGDRYSLYLKEKEKEKFLRDGFFSVLTPDGSKYAYGEGTKDRLRVLMKSTGWWPFWSSTLCENCGMPRGFSPDNRKLLLWNDTPPIHHLDVLDVGTHTVNRIVWAADDLSGPRLSPDGRWVSFVAKMGEQRWQTFVAPIWPEKLLASFEWIPIAPVSDSFHFAFWSTRGDILYILTAHDGNGNLKWLEAQRLDAETKRPIGSSIPMHEFDDLFVPGMDPIWNTISAVDDRIILELGRVSTNVWIK